jgi:hypothetical protein
LVQGTQSFDLRTNPATSAPSLGIYFPLNLPCGLPRSVTVIGLDDRAGFQARFLAVPWHPSVLLHKTVGQINNHPPGKYRILVDTSTGTAEATATVTEYGGKVDLAFPQAEKPN